MRFSDIFKHPSLSRITLALALGALAAVTGSLLYPTYERWSIANLILAAAVLAVAVGYPVALTISQLIRATRALRGDPLPSSDAGLDLWTLFLALIYEVGYLAFSKEVVFTADWQQQLANNQTHTPLFTGSWTLITVIVLLFTAAFFVLRFAESDALPPLAAVASISALYLGLAYAIAWTIQITTFESPLDALLILPLVALIAIVVKVIAYQVRQYQADSDRRGRIDGSRVLSWLDSFLADAKRYPLVGFALALPFLGVVVAVLALFGQSPSVAVRAFTETADWNLSTQVAPPNLFLDEHYLCTVAAGGHASLVKPLRMGLRHGRPVVVNRQLLVANAFEQVLQERVPRTHRTVRHIYDRYGFPVARLIRTKFVADLVWILMKPAEWIFLAVIYAVDAHPEDRIAVQYTK